MTTFASPESPAERADATPTRGAHEGLRAGLLAATSVWAWMLADDLLSREPLRTPTLLGRGLLSVAMPDVAAPAWVAATTFTLLHYALWIGLGALVSRVVRLAQRTPSVLAAVVFLTILVVLATVVVSAIASQGRLGVGAWASLGLSNVIGWGVLWWYTIRRHHELRAELARASDDD